MFFSYHAGPCRASSLVDEGERVGERRQEGAGGEFEPKTIVAGSGASTLSTIM